MAFHWSLNDSTSLQVSSILLSILADLSNSLVRMVSACPLLCNSSNPLSKYLGTVPSASIMIGITVTPMFGSFFFSSLARSKYLSLFSFSLNFTLLSAGTTKSTSWLSFTEVWVSPGLSEKMASSWQRKEAEGTPQKQLPTPTTPMT